MKRKRSEKDLRAKKTQKHTPTNSSDTLSLPTENGCLSIDGELPKELVDKYALGGESFETLWSLQPKEPGKVLMYGKETIVPRWQQPYLNDYHFSGMNHEAIPDIPDILKPLFDWVQDTIHAKDKDGPFNQLLMNGYKNGHDYISAHSDNETQLKKNSAILSISLGETRVFRITGKDGSRVMDIPLEHGRVVTMKNEMQKMYKHAIVKVGGKKGEKLGRRINITFRKFK